MADLQVDLDGLDGFAHRLAVVGEALRGAKTVLRGYDEAIGQDAVLAGLHRFEDRWRDGRDTIEANAGTLGEMVTQSVATYRQADNDLATALRPADQP